MKLYCTPGTCSLAPHIVLEETKTPYSAVKTDIRAKKVEDGSDFFKINPNGYVPALMLDDGTILTEAAVIMQYIADKAGARSLRLPTERSRATSS
jgi:glutathione S-transferase